MPSGIASNTRGRKDPNNTLDSTSGLPAKNIIWKEAIAPPHIMKVTINVFSHLGQVLNSFFQTFLSFIRKDTGSINPNAEKNTNLPNIP